MFDAISEGINQALGKLRAAGRLTEDNIKEGLREVRLALLAADVNLKVVKEFIKQVTERAVGQEVIRHVRPGEQIVKIVHDELVRLMGPGADTRIRNNPQGPTVILMAGLQGSGKTTTCGKLGAYLARKGNRPLLVAADLQRPAAIEQLQTLGAQLGLPVYSEAPGAGVRAPKVCQRGIEEAVRSGRDMVILDTAGRLHVDQELMREIKEVAQLTQPQEIFLVCDAMTGQDAVNSAQAFNQELEISGVILTKLDGDARGGAALSVKAITGKPIKFVGLGEKLDKLEEFHPDRMAGRILGMGDVVGLVEKAQESMDAEQALKLQEKLVEGSFDLDDFRKQLQTMKKMGPLKDLLGMIPGLGKQLKGMEIDDRELVHIEAIINSMTHEERKTPRLINGKRRFRIAHGSGTQIQDVNDLLNQFKEMQRMMKALTGGPGGKMGGLGRMLRRRR